MHGVTAAAAVQIAEPRRTAALAVFVVAADHDERRAGEDGLAGREPVGVPRHARVAPAVDALRHDLRAVVLAVVVVTDVDEQIGMHGRDRLRDLRKRPVRDVAAVLLLLAQHPAAGVAEDDDRARRARRRRKMRAFDSHVRRAGGQRCVADDVVESRATCRPVVASAPSRRRRSRTGTFAERARARAGCRPRRIAPRRRERRRGSCGPFDQQRTVRFSSVQRARCAPSASRSEIAHPVPVRV